MIAVFAVVMEAVVLTFTLSLGAFNSSGSLEILYDFGGPVAGFQFDVTGLALLVARVVLQMMQDLILLLVVQL